MLARCLALFRNQRPLLAKGSEEPKKLRQYMKHTPRAGLRPIADQSGRVLTTKVLRAISSTPALFESNCLKQGVFRVPCDASHRPRHARLRAGALPR
jgi:hypothetical protein